MNELFETTVLNSIDLRQVPPPLFQYIPSEKSLVSMVLFHHRTESQVKETKTTIQPVLLESSILDLTPACAYPFGRLGPFLMLHGCKTISRNAAIFKTTHHSVMVTRTGNSKIRIKRDMLPPFALEKNRDYLLHHHDVLTFGDDALPSLPSSSSSSSSSSTTTSSSLPTTTTSLDYSFSPSYYSLLIRYSTEIDRPLLPPPPPRKSPDEGVHLPPPPSAARATNPNIHTIQTHHSNNNNNNISTNSMAHNNIVINHPSHLNKQVLTKTDQFGGKTSSIAPSISSSVPRPSASSRIPTEIGTPPKAGTSMLPIGYPKTTPVRSQSRANAHHVVDDDDDDDDITPLNTNNHNNHNNHLHNNNNTNTAVLHPQIVDDGYFPRDDVLDAEVEQADDDEAYVDQSAYGRSLGYFDSRDDDGLLGVPPQAASSIHAVPFPTNKRAAGALARMHNRASHPDDDELDDDRTPQYSSSKYQRQM